MTLSTLYLGKYGLVIYSGHAGLLVSRDRVSPAESIKGASQDSFFQFGVRSLRLKLGDCGGKGQGLDW